jgi:hypothetical protein
MGPADWRFVPSVEVDRNKTYRLRFKPAPQDRVP